MKETEKKKKIVDGLLRESKKEKRKYKTRVLEKEFVVYPNVFSPKYFNDTAYFAKALPFKKGTKMLEIGTGTGAIAILGLLNGIREVVATDVCLTAINNAKENARVYNVQEKMRIIKSDMFEGVKNEKFDMIFFNAPFCFTASNPRSLLEKALFDCQYRTLKKYVGEAGSYIAPNGHIFLGFSPFLGDKRRLKAITKETGQKIRLHKKGIRVRKGEKIQLELLEIIPSSRR